MVASETLVQYKTTSTQNVEMLPTYISWEAFKKMYLDREDGFKYEWLNGTIEKTERTMDKTQFYIINNLINHFTSYKIKHQIDGQLITEGDVFFLDKHRRPDMAYFTIEQIELAADDKLDSAPEFVIEIISPTDNINRVNTKIGNYRDAKVKVVWHIFPESKEIHVYGQNNLDTVYIKRGDMICSADSVLPDFKMTVSDIFKRKKA
jgi:Uma2 family endonuclease